MLDACQNNPQRSALFMLPAGVLLLLIPDTTRWGSGHGSASPTPRSGAGQMDRPRELCLPVGATA